MSAIPAKPFAALAQKATQEAAPKTAKLFKNGRSQAVRLPKEFSFEGTEIAVRRDPMTQEVILSPLIEPQPETWETRFAVWDSLGSPEEDELQRDEALPVERDFF